MNCRTHVLHKEFNWLFGLIVFVWFQTKPVINQVNLDSCCVMPKDLVEYAELNDIQLLTHNDPKSKFSYCIVAIEVLK